MSCLLISGYRRHGKDTFLRTMIETADDPEGVTTKYDIYINEESNLSVTQILACPAENYKRFAFADTLKQEIAKILDVDVEYLENSKSVLMKPEHIQRYPYELPSNPIYRDTMIHLGLHMRRTVGDWYWVKSASDNISLSNDDIPCVTDFRFLSELSFAKYVGRSAVTLMVYRENVDIPPLDDISEHSLDTYPFDMIAVPKGQNPDQLFRNYLKNGCKYFRIC